ncbi:MAG: PAS domain S-box protein [Thiohalomonadales bacterium]
MNIKAKLILTFLSISLISIVISNSILYFHEKENATREILNHLESVASIQRTRIQGLYQQNMERLRLVASRTQLRISLDKYNQTGEILHQNKMNRIIADAKKSIDDFKVILIVALDGKVVAATNKSRIDQNITNTEIFYSGKKENRVNFFELDENQNLMVMFSGPLYLKEKLLGVLVIESSINTMMSSIKDYTGLGETGETVLATRTSQGDAVFIMPTRFNKDAALNLRINSNQTNIPMIYAVNGDEKLFENYIDYRDKAVLAVTRYIKGPEWGLVVKIDKSEAFSYLIQMRNTVIAILIIFSIIIIIISIYISRQITQPIIKLTNTAKKIIEGDLFVRADETSNDETGLLGRTFNLMTASLLSEQEKLNKSKEQLASSEALFRGVLESAIDGVLMVDNKGIILLANEALSNLTGFSIDELVGETVEKLVPASFDTHTHQREEYFKNPTTRPMDSGLNIFSCRKDGTQFPVEVSLTPVVTEQGTVVAAIIQDVTVRIQIEREKEQLLKSLELKNAELERFTYTVSHDLKSPLVTISGFIGLLEKDVAENNKERMYSDFEKIRDAANTMQHLLNDLLELSRIGRETITRVDVAVEDLVNSVLKLLTATITTTQAKIIVESELPTIHVEEARFKEVYLNLIENAIKYRRVGVIPEIIIGVRRDINNSNKEVFFVKDNGIGIDARYQKKIFGLFERLSNANEGTGVGLAIVKRIMDIHDGRIWVESDGVGYGSTFNFVISQNDETLHRGV